MTEEYDDWAAAEAAGAVDRGWIPEFIPRSATNIRDTHNLDSNSQRLELELQPDAIEEMTLALGSLSPAEAEQVRDMTGIDREKIYYFCRNPGDGIVVVDGDQGQIALISPSPVQLNCSDDRA